MPLLCAVFFYFLSLFHPSIHHSLSRTFNQFDDGQVNASNSQVRMLIRTVGRRKKCFFVRTINYDPTAVSFYGSNYTIFPLQQMQFYADWRKCFLYVIAKNQDNLTFPDNALRDCS